MAERIEDAIAGALRLGRRGRLAHGRGFRWEASADPFLAALEPGLAPPLTRLACAAAA